MKIIYLKVFAIPVACICFQFQRSQDHGPARERELYLFLLQRKVGSSDVILARISCLPDACVVACVCRRELSKFVETNK